MKLKLDNLPARREWLALAAGLAAAALMYFVLIHPSWQLVGQHDTAVTARAAAADELARVRGRYQQVQEGIARGQRRLNALGGSPPAAADKERQIARLAALAGACQLTVDQYSPIELIEEEDHQAALLQFAARGTSAAIQRYFERVEAEIDFVDVTHFAVSAVPTGGAPMCLVSWSCRINGLRPLGPAPDPAGEPPASPATPQEVVLHEP